MALAYGYGSHVGFGLGFLNFLGTILFFLFLFWVLKTVLRSVKHGCAGHYATHHEGASGSAPFNRLGFSGGRFEKPAHEDEALRTARMRFAEGVLNQADFTVVKDALIKHAATRQADGRGMDKALRTVRLRLASGEISPEEFEQVVSALG